MRKILQALAATSWPPIHRESSMVLAASNASPGKTPGSRFDTLIVRGDRRMQPDDFRARKQYSTTEARRAKASFKGASHKKHEPSDYAGYRCNCGFGLCRRGLLLAAYAREPSHARGGVGGTAGISRGSPCARSCSPASKCRSHKHAYCLRSFEDHASRRSGVTAENG